MKRITSLGRGGSKNFTRNSRIVTKEHQGHYLNDPMNNIPTDVHYFDTQGFRVIISQRFFDIFSLSLSLSFFFIYERYNIACFNFLVLAVFFVEQSWFSLFVINAVSHFVMLAIFKKKEKNEISIFFFIFVTKRYIYLRVDRKTTVTKSIIIASSILFVILFELFPSYWNLLSISSKNRHDVDSNRSFRTSYRWSVDRFTHMCVCVCVCVFVCVSHLIARIVNFTGKLTIRRGQTRFQNK